MNRTHTSTRTFLSLATLAALITGGLLYAGPLNPPAGPVASTFKTLTEVEPRTPINATNTPGDPLGDPSPSLFKITQPGSYYLTGNITGVIGKHGIEIAASGVTVDLNGFDLVGVPAMGAFDGVSTTVFGLTNIAVVNGSVRNWGDMGVDLGTSPANNCRVEGVLASGNTGLGISASSGSTVSNCSAFSNTGGGFLTGNSGTVSNCSALGNTGDGFIIGSAYTVSNCSAASNIGVGIRTINVCTVADCIVRENRLDGIVCGGGNLIRGNTCSFNGGGIGDGAGIHATGADNRIEGNNCFGADRGIDVDLAGNIIIGNTCSGNGINWTIVANNYYGPIIDRTGAATAAVNGPAAAGTLATTDPHANFSY